MFRRKVQPLDDVLNMMLRENGLETPLNQRRIISAWDDILGPTVARFTGKKFIKNQTLMVEVTNPALRADLSMMRTELVRKLNAAVGAQTIADVKVY